MADLPKVTNYGRYNSSNYGAHTLCISMLGVDVYFSYNTPVAFRTISSGLVVHENIWGPTTGKHLNFIDGGGVDRRKRRVSGEGFDRLWKEHVESRLKPEKKRKQKVLFTA